MPPSAVEPIALRSDPVVKVEVKTEREEPEDYPEAFNRVEAPHRDPNIDHREPLKLNGALDKFEHFDVTPIIGREYVDVDLVEWMKAPNADELLRDLAITISRRSVVFFRRQDKMTDDLANQLVQRLGELTGKPATSGLSVPIFKPVEGQPGRHDTANISTINSDMNWKMYPRLFSTQKTQSMRRQWHTDEMYEPVPPDYTLLRMTQVPRTGGDTVWASQYELHDRLSKPLREFLATLTWTCVQPGFHQAVATGSHEFMPGERGAPENIGTDPVAINPVVRTNPVTGWRALSPTGPHFLRINGLAEEESQYFLNWFLTMVMENHDLQVRNRWQNPNDMAIWDNRCTVHAPTPDYYESQHLGKRDGHRSVGVGEKPYFDPKSVSRREGLWNERSQDVWLE